MGNPFLEIHKLLDDFENEISKIREIWKQPEIDNPGSEQVSGKNWQEKQAKMWLHGETGVWECNELARWLYADLPATKIAQSPALDVYKAWREWLKTSGIPKFTTTFSYDKKTKSYIEIKSKEPSNTYYADDNRFDIEKPAKDETLYSFIIRLAHLVEDEGKRQGLEWRALKSFLGFLRNTYPKEQVAFIEHIFPYKMSLHYGKITRLISPKAYPIPENTAANILMELACRCRNSRRNAQHTAIESLALCWLCIATSRVRLPKTLEMVNNIKSTAIFSGEEFSISTTPTYGGNEFWRPLVDSDFSVLLVPTLFGEQPLKISNRLYTFLKAVSCLSSKQPRETILQKPRRSLTRMFDEALKSVKPNPKYGNITYLSLLNQPHIFGDHRYQPKPLKTNA